MQKKETPNFYQQRDYKVLPPDAVDNASAEKYWPSTPPMIDTLINSVVAVPADNETLTVPSSGEVEVKGYAVPQGADGPLTRVEVSADNGESWIDADLNGSSRDSKWSWVLWTATMKLPPGTGREIWSRATDAGGNTQKQHSQWNLRGLGYCGYGRARNLTVVES